MFDYDKNAMYDHCRSVMQCLRNLCERYNLLIADEFLPEQYFQAVAEIKAACNMAKACGYEIRLFKLNSFDVSQVCKIWVHDTTTGEVMLSAVGYVNESGELVYLRKNRDFHPYFIKREFNVKGGKHL